MKKPINKPVNKTTCTPFSVCVVPYSDERTCKTCDHRLVLVYGDKLAKIQQTCYATKTILFASTLNKGRQDLAKEIIAIIDKDKE